MHRLRSLWRIENGTIVSGCLILSVKSLKAGWGCKQVKKKRRNTHAKQSQLEVRGRVKCVESETPLTPIETD